MKNYEIEKKFLIKKPNEDMLLSIKECQKNDIEQIYLKKNSDGLSKRIRKRTNGDNTIYYYTEKKHISNIKREENEKIITLSEYKKYKAYADENLNTINKKRYCIPYKNHTLEIDIFPFWQNQAYLEIELQSEDEIFDIPDFIEIIKDVTEDKNYTNHSLAKEIPKENSWNFLQFIFAVVPYNIIVLTNKSISEMIKWTTLHLLLSLSEQ